MPVRLRFPTAAAILVAWHFAVPARAQQTVHDHIGLGWFVYNGEHAFARRWTMEPEAQVRRVGVVRTWQELQLRQSIGFEASRAVKLAAAYTYAREYPYGRDPEPFAVPEHRLHEQATLTHESGRWRMGHRFRVEHRFLGQLPNPPARRVDRWEYETRLRYRFQPRRDLGGGWHLRITAEPHFRIGRGRAFDQQRTYAGIGREVAKDLSLEAGYMYRLDAPSTGRLFEHDHILQLTLSWDAPLRRGIQ